jgi:hypothetical protein
MEIKVVKGDITKSAANSIVLSYFEDSAGLENEISAIDKTLEGTISKLINQREITGKFKKLQFWFGKPETELAIRGWENGTHSRKKGCRPKCGSYAQNYNTIDLFDMKITLCRCHLVNRSPRSHTGNISFKTYIQD